MRHTIAPPPRFRLEGFQNMKRRRPLLMGLVFAVVAALGFAAPMTAVAAGNPPVANPDSWEVYSEVGTLFPLSYFEGNDTDQDGDLVGFASLGTMPANGTLNVLAINNSLSFTYTPVASYNGLDSFSYRVVDQQGNVSNFATVTISVLGFGPHKDSYSATSGQLLSVTTANGLIQNDSNGNNAVLTVAVTVPPSHGTLSMNADNAGSFNYTSVAGWTGKDTFKYRLKNSAGTLSKYEAVVTIDVKPVMAILTGVKITKLIAGVPGGTGSVTAQITSGNAVKSGVTIDAVIDGVVAGSGVTDASGQAVFPVAMPANPASYSLVVSNAGFSDSRSIVVSYSPIVTSLQITHTPGGLIGTKDVLNVKITSGNTALSGAPIGAFLDGILLGGTLSQLDGTASFALVLPSTPGSHVLKVVSGPMSVTKTIQVNLPAPVVNSITLAVPAGKPGQGVYLTTKITSANPFKAGAPVSAYIDGKKITTKLTDATGTAKLPVKLPSLAGKHSIKVVAGSKSAVKNFTLGKAVTAKLAKLTTIKRYKTETIKGSFGYKAGKITLKITNPKGKTVTKIVKLSSTGKFTYKYKVSGVKGTWTVRYSYNANSKYYGAKSYKLTFKVK